MSADHNLFLSKLDELSGGRSKTPWLQSVGLTKGTISRLINGDQPSLDILTALARTENASLDWLSNDRGAPHRVGIVSSDIDGWVLLDELLQETGWTLFQFSDPTGALCLVLTQPGEFEIKGRAVPYTIVEILAGAIGPQTMNRAISAMSDGTVSMSAEISEDEFDRLTHGHMGNYELIGWRGEHGLIHTATATKSEIMTQVAEVRDDDMTGISRSEMQLINRFRKLSVQDQQRLLKIAETLDQT